MEIGFRISTSTVANIAIDKLIDDLLKIRLRPRTNWSSPDSDPKIGERFWGRIGREEPIGLPTSSAFAPGYFDNHPISTSPYGNYEWITPEICEK